ACHSFSHKSQTCAACLDWAIGRREPSELHGRGGSPPVVKPCVHTSTVFRKGRITTRQRTCSPRAARPRRKSGRHARAASASLPVRVTSPPRVTPLLKRKH